MIKTYYEVSSLDWIRPPSHFADASVRYHIATGKLLKV